tara:strand:+ start:321 stop:557 length:237 start_codon:yes stop_codon:yes gene_type:complete
MKRIKLNKEKMDYKQIIYPNPKDKESFIGAYFNAVLPHKLMVSDKSVKELSEVTVKFKILKTWKEHWPQAKVVEIIRD